MSKVASATAGITFDCGTPTRAGGPWTMVGVTVGGRR